MINMEKITFTVTTQKSVYDFILKVGESIFTFNITAEIEASAQLILANMLEKMSVALKS